MDWKEAHEAGAQCAMGRGEGNGVGEASPCRVLPAKGSSGVLFYVTWEATGDCEQERVKILKGHWLRFGEQTVGG